ncbi:MAG: SpoIVB peptidase [Clostridium sp.]|nr:SpoIVB peptidase [Clostridium sp.]MCM1548147.1 SpoIVB peptidase [Ruminococcus sp.]
MKNFFKPIFAVVTLFIFNICAIVGYYSINLPDSFYVSTESPLTLSTRFSIEAEKNDIAAAFAGEISPNVETVDLKLFGVIPVKNVELHTVETPVLIPGGDPFGIKLLMDGVMVVGTGEVKTANGMICPAAECGIEIGNVILSLNGKKIASNNDIAGIVSASKGQPLEVVYTDGESEKVSLITPAYSLPDCCYKAGIWVRDSTAGIGTVTFYEPETGRFGGLGHPVCDTDTGEIIPISSGEAAEVEITGVVKGDPGQPGELKGRFSSKRLTGIISSNNKYGVFGELFSDVPNEKAVSMALKQEVKVGKAYIISTIDESGSQKFEIEIEKIDSRNTGTKNMVIKVTDKRLLEKTGGIVQGMSGSPIIQNEKLVGAVTHVFVSDPERGYGIFAENMYEWGIKG